MPAAGAAHSKGNTTVIRSNSFRQTLSRLSSTTLRAGTRSAALGAALLIASTATVMATANTRPTITTATVTPNVLKEGEQATLNFAFTDPDVSDYHALRVRWRDGGVPYTVQHNVPFGQHSMQLPHTFLDDNQNSPYWKSIRVTLYDRQSAPGQSPNDNTGDAGVKPYIDIPITVKNAPPSFVYPSLTVTKAPVRGGAGIKVTVEGRVTDPSTKDVLQVNAYFSDPATPNYVPCTMTDNTRRFICEHVYPRGFKPTSYWIPLNVKDDDGGEGVYQTTVQVP